MGILRSTRVLELEAKFAALDKSQAIIEFDLQAMILHANNNFLNVMGYTLEEIRGQHHSIFVDAAERESAGYKAFWAALRTGTFQAAQYKRLAKGGREVWIEASYNPLFDRAGRPYKIVKFATDITRQKAEDAERQGRIAAIGKSQAVIAFDLDGTILEANENFLGAVGYALPEILGRHHRLFVDETYGASEEYTAFWAKLRGGQYQAGQFRRLGKDGREIWIEASYNPILDASGRPFKVVKFATDITAQMGLLADLDRLIDRNVGAIDEAVQDTNRQSSEAAQSVETTSESVQAMASAAEELAASIGEISSSMAKARAATGEAQSGIRVTSEVTQALSEAASAMGGIVGLIQSIAGQINLLALNATIEAARAGEAGRGFAVVAHEVKTLASQAAGATDRISREIDRVQSVSRQVVDALGLIEGSIANLRDYVVSTAAAVEEQSAVTREMSASMQGAAGEVVAISRNMGAISGSIARVSQAVATTKEAARVLAR